MYVWDEKSSNIEPTDTKNIYCLIRKSWNVELKYTKKYLLFN